MSQVGFSRELKRIIQSFKFRFGFLQIVLQIFSCLDFIQRGSLDQRGNLSIRVLSRGGSDHKVVVIAVRSYNKVTHSHKCPPKNARHVVTEHSRKLARGRVGSGSSVGNDHFLTVVNVWRQSVASMDDHDGVGPSDSLSIWDHEMGANTWKDRTSCTRRFLILCLICLVCIRYRLCLEKNLL